MRIVLINSLMGSKLLPLRRLIAASWQIAVLLALLVGVNPAAHCASKTLLVLGDSLSAEYGLQRGTGWVALLDAKLQAQKADIQIINASISGETSSGGKTRLPALLEKHRPQFLIIELGGNDGLRGLPLKAFNDNLQAMISAAQKSGAKVLLLGMKIPPNYGTDYTQKFSATYQELAQKYNTGLVPFFLQGVAEKEELFQSDHIHPIAIAHPTMLNTVWPAVEKLLNLNTTTNTNTKAKAK